MSCCDNPFQVCAFNIAKGDEFNLVFCYELNDVPQDVTNLDFSAFLYDSSAVLVQELSVAKADQATQPGYVVCSATEEQTGAWPVDVLTCAIIENNGGAVNSFPEFKINVSARP